MAIIKLRARELLVALISFVAAGPSFWYTINGDTTSEFSLCWRLGFFCEVDYYVFLVAEGLAGYAKRRGKITFDILGEEWKSFLKNDDYDLSAYKCKHLKKRFDLEAVRKGKNQVDENRFDYHVIRFGRRNSDSYASNITKQIIPSSKKFITTPPTLPALCSQQRTLTRGS